MDKSVALWGALWISQCEGFVESSVDKSVGLWVAQWISQWAVGSSVDKSVGGVCGELSG